MFDDLYDHSDQVASFVKSPEESYYTYPAEEQSKSYNQLELLILLDAIRVE
jgi:hypothetical protein